MMHIFHDWQVYEVQRAWHGFIFAGEPTNPCTFVKSRCTKCNKLKREQIDGHWTLWELTGEKGVPYDNAEKRPIR